jgi:glycosyltransferase involved in cell wall biosynthesis
VIVPTRARLPQLRACLQSLAALDYPREQFEVIVVNDGSPPLAESELVVFRNLLDIRCIDQAWAGPAGARNNGVSHARGRFIAFTDDDCTVAPNWLTVFEHALRVEPTALVGGYSKNALEDDVCASASQLLIDYLYEYYHSKKDSRSPKFFTSNNMCARADLLRQLGPFDTSFRLPAGEDRDLSDRWTWAGFPLQYCPEALVLHWHRMSLRSFTRQHLNYGRGAMIFHTARAQRQNAPLRIEPL